MIALALAANDAYDIPGKAERFRSRFGRLLSRLKVDIEFAGLRVGATSEDLSVQVPGASASISLKSELKNSKPFADELRSRLAYHVGELYSDVAGFLAELASAAGVDSSKAVLIVDGLEKLQGTRRTTGRCRSRSSGCSSRTPASSSSAGIT